MAAISAFHSGECGLKAFGGGGFVGLAAGFVEAEFDDRDVGVGGREEVVEVGLGEGEFDLVEGFKGVAEVDEDQVAFVAELGEEGGADGGVRGGCVPELGERGDGFGGDACCVRRPRRTRQDFQSKRKNWWRRAGAFKSERDGGEVGQGERLSFQYSLIVTKGG